MEQILMQGVQPPIFILEGEDEVNVFPTVEKAAGWVEPIDVEDGVYEAFDSRGVRLELSVRKEPGRWRELEVVEISPSETVPSGMHRLAERLRRLFGDGTNGDDLTNATLAQLVDMARSMTW